MEAVLPNGLIMGHAYSVTDVRLVEITAGGTNGKIPLVRVRNPWGNEVRLSLVFSSSFSPSNLSQFNAAAVLQTVLQTYSLFTLND